MIQKICNLLKEELFDDDQSFISEYSKDGREVIEITDDVVIGEAPDFVLSRMDEIVLVEPSLEYAEDLWAFRQEIIDKDTDNDNADQFAGCMSMNSSSSAEEWISICTLRKDEKTCEEVGTTVPSHTFLAIRKSDNRIVGVIDLRHHIDHPILGTWGGHCGYSVRPSERRQGYATEMLRLNKLKAKEMGISKMLVTCDERNAASEKTILANGGVYEKTIDVDGDKIKRFWIDTE
jgi:predicted acetyltransferase